VAARAAGVVRTCWSWVTTAAGRGREKVAAAVAALRQGQEELAGRIRSGISALASHVWLAGFVARTLVWRLRKPLLVALAGGLVIGVGCYLAGPAVASTVSGLASFAGTLAASLVGRLRRVISGAELREWYISRLP
jgi:hypothetical protein